MNNSKANTIEFLNKLLQLFGTGAYFTTLKPYVILQFFLERNGMVV